MGTPGSRFPSKPPSTRCVSRRQFPGLGPVPSRPAKEAFQTKDKDGRQLNLRADWVPSLGGMWEAEPWATLRHICASRRSTHCTTGFERVRHKKGAAEYLASPVSSV